MPIFRWIIICLAVWLVIAILRQLFERRRQSISHSRSPTASQYSDMVACQQCHVHIPKAEAIRSDGRYYCSEKCNKKYRDAV